MRRYAERGSAVDTSVFIQIPRLINNSERKIATELKILGFLVPTNLNLVKGQAVYEKPDRWRETVSLNFGKATVYSTVTRAAAAGVRTLVFAKPHPFVVGSVVLVAGLGGVAYNSTAAGVAVTAITQLSIVYTIGAATEGTTGDTGGRACLVPDKRTPVFPRSYEYLRQYWPDDTVEGDPEFYADYDYNHFIVAPTPQMPYPAELNYYELLQLLDDTNQTNWLTDFAPNLLLYGSLLELAPFLKNDERIPVWQTAYDRIASGISQQDIGRMQDRASQRNTA